MIVSDLIGLFQTMYKEHWAYKWGVVEKGTVDCSGAFVYAYKALANKSIPHGSNALARRWIVGGMLPLSMAKPGMAAFKAYYPGDEYYDLPERYKPGGSAYNNDLTDYHHIGLVDEDTRYVLNARGEKYGFCRNELSTKNGWAFVAFLKSVDYPDGEVIESMKAKVVLAAGESGSTVNLREGKSKSYRIIKQVPTGTVVNVIADEGAWSKIIAGGESGYMMSNHLEYIEGDAISDVGSGEAAEKIDAALTAAEKALEELRKQLEIIGSVNGRG